MRCRWILVLLVLVLSVSSGCPNNGKDIVGNPSNQQPPPNVKEDIARRDQAYAEMMRKQQENPTPSGEQAPVPN